MNEEEYIPLLDAIKGGDVAAVEYFLQTLDIDVDSFFVISDEDYYFTALHWAIRHNQQTIVEVLLAHGASVNGPLGALMTPLQDAAAHYANEDIVKLLLDHGADVDETTAESRQTPLTGACNSNTKLGIVQLLINAGADLNGGGGVTAPLHRAAYCGNTDAIELLIQAGANVNRVSTQGHALYGAGRTPLHYAASEVQLDCLNILLAAGAGPNIASAAGETPLRTAPFWSSVEVINALLNTGCDPLHRDNDGRTPLQHLYAEYNRFFSVKHFNSITALVAAGDRSWECVPTPCPGLEAAMLAVWQAAPDELPELFKRMENPPQTLIELYARMDDDDDDDAMKKVVQEVLRVLHRHFAGFPHLKEHLLKSIFGFTTSV